MSHSQNQNNEGKVTRRGMLLKETRESKGLSIETVHEMTKIPLDVLHAIEEGYTVRMVSAYYFKGFIKMYAKFLGLDSSLVLDEPVSHKNRIEENVPVVKSSEHRKFNEYILRQSKKQLKINLFFSGIILIVLLIGLFIFKHSQGRETHPKSIKVPQQTESSSKKLLKTQAADRKVVEKTKPKPKIDSKVVKKEPVRASTPVEAAPVRVVETPTEPVKNKVGEKVTLTIKTRTAGWLQVKVDGNLVFQSTLRSGAVESWEADQTIELSGKNVNNLEFEVNGKVLGQLGRSDRGARRVVITKDGLTVKN